MKILHRRTGRIYKVTLETSRKFRCIDENFMKPKEKRFWKSECRILVGSGKAPRALGKHVIVIP